MFRSGSTLVEQLLAPSPGDHRRAASSSSFRPWSAKICRPIPQAWPEASAERFDALRDKYLEQLRRLFPDAARVTDKRPDNFLHIGADQGAVPRRAHRPHRPQPARQYPLGLLPLFRRRRRLQRPAGRYRPLLCPIPPPDGPLAGAVRQPTFTTSTTTGWSPTHARTRAAAGLLRPRMGRRLPRPMRQRRPCERRAIGRCASRFTQRSSGRWRNYARELEAVRRRRWTPDCSATCSSVSAPAGRTCARAILLLLSSGADSRRRR